MGGDHLIQFVECRPQARRAGRQVERERPTLDRKRQRPVGSGAEPLEHREVGRQTACPKQLDAAHDGRLAARRHGELVLHKAVRAVEAIPVSDQVELEVVRRERPLQVSLAALRGVPAQRVEGPHDGWREQRAREAGWRRQPGRRKPRRIAGATAKSPGWRRRGRRRAPVVGRHHDATADRRPARHQVDPGDRVAVRIIVGHHGDRVLERVGAVGVDRPPR
jgi:hypothetical protein